MKMSHDAMPASREMRLRMLRIAASTMSAWQKRMGGDGASRFLVSIGQKVNNGESAEGRSLSITSDDKFAMKCD